MDLYVRKRCAECAARIYSGEFQVVGARRRDVRTEAFIRGYPTPTITLKHRGHTVYSSEVRREVSGGSEVADVASGADVAGGAEVSSGANVAGGAKVSSGAEVAGGADVSGGAAGSIKYCVDWFGGAAPLVLTIRNVEDGDGGEYTIEVANPGGTDSHTFTLLIAEPPHLVAPPPPYVELLERWGGKVSCQISGWPVPRVRWYKDWRLVASSSRIQVVDTPDVYDLLISNAIDKDSGQYTCVAENVAGRVVAHCYVQIKPVTPYMTKNYSKHLPYALIKFM